MIRRDDLIALFETMYRERWAYEWGAARRGCVDCSGAFVWAYKQLGASIYHGSNTIARRHVGNLIRPSGTFPKGEGWGRVLPGYAAFKWRKTDTAKYPDGRGDFYHIGLVDASGEYVLNAKGKKEGFCRDPVKGWHCFAPLADVAYSDDAAQATGQTSSVTPGGATPSPKGKATGTNEGGQTMTPYNAIVSTSSGSLNMRSGPGTSYPVIFKLPKNTPVTVLVEYDTGWAFVDEDGTQGYVSMEYLRPLEKPEPEPEPEPDEVVMRYGVWVPCETMDQAVALAAAHPGSIFTAYKPPDAGA